MTLEEAVEVVLSGVTYLRCKHCDGERFVGPIERLGSPENYVFMRATCVACQGYGNFLNPVYAFACGMTSTVLPGRPSFHRHPMREMALHQAQWGIVWEEDQRILEVLEATASEGST